MKNRIQTIVAAALFAGVVSAQAAPSADEILKKHVAAIGGEAAFKKTKSREMVAVMDIPAQGMSANMKILAKAPNKMRSELDIPGMGKIVEGFDGKVAWSQNPFTGLLEKEGGQLEQAQKQADYYRDIEIAKRFESWKLNGKETVDGKEAWVVVGSSPGGDSETLYIDANSFLMLKVTAKTDTPNGKVDASTVLSDYRTVEGLKIPYLIKIQTPMGDMSLKVKEMNFNVEAPDSLFSKPTN